MIRPVCKLNNCSFSVGIQLNNPGIIDLGSLYAVPSKATLQMRHLSPGLIYFSVLTCLLRGMFCARLPSMTDSAVFKAEHLEAIMFPDQVDAARYRRMCGSDWHRLFQAWEIQQKLALSGDNAIQLVIWRCPQACGGLGDRQRGILTSFT